MVKFTKRVKSNLKLLVLLIILIGFLVPQNLSIPVEGASKTSYHSKSFWYYPWGKSITHKGVDIFAKLATPVIASTNGLVVYCGTIAMGGNIIIVLGPKWRFHYYAHLNEIKVTPFSWVRRNALIGTVGTSGNAKGKSPHLHYAIATPIPYVWRIDSDKQGWKKAFYLNPIDYFNE